MRPVCSGAKYSRVPSIWLGLGRLGLSFGSRAAIPKSIKQIFLDPGLTNILLGFRSLWITRLLWQKATASLNWIAISKKVSKSRDPDNQLDNATRFASSMMMMGSSSLPASSIGLAIHGWLSEFCKWNWLWILAMLLRLGRSSIKPLAIRSLPSFSTFQMTDRLPRWIFSLKWYSGGRRMVVYNGPTKVKGELLECSSESLTWPIR